MTTESVRAARCIGLRRHLQPKIVAGDAVYLLSERGTAALRGAHVEAVVPLLDGTRDRDTLIDAAHGLSRETVAGVLDRLDAAGLLTMHERAGTSQGGSVGNTHRATLAYWDAAGLNALDASARLAAAVVSVIEVGAVRSAPILAALVRAGLATPTVYPHDGGIGGTSADSPADLAVVLCADYADPRLAGIADKLRRSGIPWLIARPAGEQPWIGPIFVPGEGACWTCLAARVMANRPLGYLGPLDPPEVVLPSVAGLAAELVALEASKWLAGYRHPGQKQLWACDSIRLEFAAHAVTIRPQCPSCGDPHLPRKRALEPVRVGPRRKVATYGDTGHRAMSSTEMLASYRRWVSPLTGVVRELRPDGRGPDFLKCYVSGTNIAAGRVQTLDGLRTALRCETSGKGRTAEQAEASALGEAIERYSGTYHGDEATEIASFTALGDRAVHPDTWRLQDPRQVIGRTEWNARHSFFQRLAPVFDEYQDVPWTPVWSLTRGTHRMLPTAMLYFDGPGPRGLGADSNGCAAGASIEDAVLHGLLELVERDAVALWWYNRTAQPQVDLDSTHDRWIEEMRQVYAGLGREFWVLDLTADLGIPVMAAISRRISGPEDLVFGFGAHLDPAVALTRALTELNQIVPRLLGMSARWLRDAGDADLARWLAVATVENQGYLLPEVTTRPKRLDEYRYAPSQNLADDVAAVVSSIEAAGMEVMVLDQTQPDIGLPVVRAIVPGLRHFWARFAPGRLFDVPVKLGRLAQPTPYESLNPFPMFL